MNLTIQSKTINIITTATQFAVWIGIQELHGVSRLYAVFLRSKSQFYIIMLDWVRLSFEGLVSCNPVCQPYSVRLHNWHCVVGFKSFKHGVSHD